MANAANWPPVSILLFFAWEIETPHFKFLMTFSHTQLNNYNAQSSLQWRYGTSLSSCQRNASLSDVCNFHIIFFQGDDLLSISCLFPSCRLVNQLWPCRWRQALGKWEEQARGSRDLWLTPWSRAMYSAQEAYSLRTVTWDINFGLVWVTYLGSLFIESAYFLPYLLQKWKDLGV